MTHAIPIRRVRNTVRTDVLSLTPADARELLELNQHNRPISDRDVLKWASEMECGRWQMNGEAIKIAIDGTILDGQHRLRALSLLDERTSIDFLVIYGLPPETQSTMDQGRKRSSSDQMNLSGIKSDKTIASAARLYLIWTNNLLFTDNRITTAKITTTKIIDWASENTDVVDLFRRGASFRPIPALRPALIAAVYARIMQDTPPGDVDEFFQQLKDGIGLPAGSPIAAFRNRLIRLSSSRVKICDRDQIGMLVRVFNDWMSGREYSKFQLPGGGRFSEKNFPAIGRNG